MQKQDVDFDQFSCLTSLQELLQSTEPPDEPTIQETVKPDEKKDEQETEAEETTETQKKTKEDFAGLLSQLCASSKPEPPKRMSFQSANHPHQTKREFFDWKSQLIDDLLQMDGVTVIMAALVKLSGVRELVEVQSKEMPSTLSQESGERWGSFCLLR